MSTCFFEEGSLDKIALSITSLVWAGAEKLLRSKLTSLHSLTGAVWGFTFSRKSLHRESWCSWILFAKFSFSSVSRWWFSSDGKSDCRYFRCQVSDPISGVKIGVKFRMHQVGIWCWLALIITSVSFAATASEVRKLVISKPIVWLQFLR